MLTSHDVANFAARLDTLVPVLGVEGNPPSIVELVDNPNPAPSIVVWNYTSRVAYSLEALCNDAGDYSYSL